MAPTSKGKTRYDMSVYGLANQHDEIGCNLLFAVGLVCDVRNMKFCGNTGKIKASDPFAKGTVYVAGLAGYGKGKLSRAGIREVSVLMVI